MNHDWLAFCCYNLLLKWVFRFFLSFIWFYFSLFVYCKFVWTSIVLFSSISFLFFHLQFQCNFYDEKENIHSIINPIKCEMIEEGNDFYECKLRVNWLNVCYFVFAHQMIWVTCTIDIDVYDHNHMSSFFVCLLWSSNLHLTTQMWKQFFFHEIN